MMMLWHHSFQGIMHGIPIMSIHISVTSWLLTNQFIPLWCQWSIVVACIRLFVGFTMWHPTVGGGICISILCFVGHIYVSMLFAAMYILVDFSRSLVSPLHMFPICSLFRLHFSLQLVTFLCLLVDFPVGSQHPDLVGGLKFEVWFLTGFQSDQSDIIVCESTALMH